MPDNSECGPTWYTDCELPKGHEGNFHRSDSRNEVWLRGPTDGTPRTVDYAQLVRAAAARTWDFPTAYVLTVHDGDTVDLNVVFTTTIDAGFEQTITTTSTQPHSFRLFGCNANELADPGGKEAQANLAAMLPTGTPLRLSSVKDDKYGSRWLAILWAKDTNGQEYNVVQRLIDTHWAVPWNGVGAKPKPPWPRPEDTK